MRPGGKRLLLGAGGLVAGLASAAAVRSRLWDRATADAAARLVAADFGSQPRVFSPEQLGGLPTPVVRYFEFALTPGQPRITGAQLRQAGNFRTGEAGCWFPFTATQQFRADSPGFVWDARIHLNRLLAVRVRDQYLDGRAAMEAQAASLVPLVDEHDRPELSEGALHRYLAEAVWFPTALLPGAGVTWSPVSAAAAVATLTDGPYQVSLEFQFGPDGEIVRASTPSRYRSVPGGYVPTPWICTYDQYVSVGDTQVPTQAEVAWSLPSGPFSYFRGQVVAISHRFSSGEAAREPGCLNGH